MKQMIQEKCLYFILQDNWHHQPFDTTYARHQYMNFKSVYGSESDFTSIYSTVSDFIDDSDISSELEDSSPRYCLPEILRRRFDFQNDYILLIRFFCQLLES